MRPSDNITTERLRALDFIQRKDLIEGYVDDCWSKGNLILYKTNPNPGWNVQVGQSISPNIVKSTLLLTLGHVQENYMDANNEVLVLPES